MGRYKLTSTQKSNSWLSTLAMKPSRSIQDSGLSTYLKHLSKKDNKNLAVIERGLNSASLRCMCWLC